jgi:cobaltochelatase CobS
MVRQRGMKAGDYARLSKEHYIRMLLDEASEEKVAVSYTQPSDLGYKASKQGEKSLGDLFGIRGKYKDIMVPVYNDPDAPEFDDKYRFDPEKLAFFAMNLPYGVWGYGPAGTGKTEFVKNFAAKCGRAFIRVSLDSGIERYELLGGERMRSGSTIYQDGLVLHGMRKPGAIILLDEVTIGRAEHLAALHGILDSGVAVIQETHERVKKAEGVDFCVCDNSNGRGDTSGVYSGIREMNYAFCDRYGAFIEFEYLSEEMEQKVLVDRTGCTVQLASLLVGLMKACRASSEAGSLEIAPTLRQTMSLARNLMWNFPPRKAWEITVVNRASEDAKEILQQIWKANMNDAVIESAVKGVTAPEVANAPEPTF